jgi:hypothetical protein
MQKFGNRSAKRWGKRYKVPPSRTADRFKAAHKAKLKADGGKLIAHVAKRYDLTEAEQLAALANFESEAKERSIWGLANAITRIGNDAQQYERASYLERVGGEIIQLPEKSGTVQ